MPMSFAVQRMDWAHVLEFDRHGLNTSSPFTSLVTLGRPLPLSQFQFSQLQNVNINFIR